MSVSYEIIVKIITIVVKVLGQDKMNKKLLLLISFVLVSQTVSAINFGGAAGRLGKELDKLNPFSSTPESRADDLYKNAESKVFDCKFGSAWLTLVDGYLTVNNRMIGQVKKLSLDKQLLVRVDTTGANFTCNVVGEDWYSGDVQEMTPCKIKEQAVLLCKRRK
ncbi:hypothetical protein ICN28_06155 [Polynucleobacter sp. 30F-ANTBAC]|uniref:hypothetical protein n=1 Tax=Polynucleobacter sp. 30F-ANTBAC TaxID=2689095 RepID=UPI001C0DDAA0|nr:hypothetical protein [Polynucleobacter sp. 30F-ANTBAC]MBU3600095.1 hypothetical protein [Polynucleobacter sp. 30F-ANTBAC]